MANLLTRFFKRNERTETAPAVRNAVVSSTDPRIIELLGVAPGAAGVAVTDESAMRVSAVYACVRLIGGAIASLPLPVYRRTATGRDRIDTPLEWLLNVEPTAAWSAASMWEWVIKCQTLRGDAFVQVLRDRTGAVAGLLPLPPSAVRIEATNGRLRYYVQPPTGAPYGLDQDDMLHFCGFGFDGMRSISVIAYAAHQAVGVALAADEFSARFYSNGGMPGFVFETEGKMDLAQQQLLKESFAQAVAGTKNAFRPFVTTQGVKLREITISPEDSQLLEARKFQVIDIARAFGIPPHMIGETEKTSSWGTGIEQMSLGFVKYTLQPYLTRIEQEVNRKLFRSPKTFCEFNLDGLLRGDSKAEADYLRQAIGGSQGMGWMTVNEARRIKNLPPVDGGDELYDPKGDAAVAATDTTKGTPDEPTTDATAA